MGRRGVCVLRKKKRKMRAPRSIVPVPVAWDLGWSRYGWRLGGRPRLALLFAFCLTPLEPFLFEARRRASQSSRTLQSVRAHERSARFDRGCFLDDKTGLEANRVRWYAPRGGLDAQESKGWKGRVIVGVQAFRHSGEQPARERERGLATWSGRSGKRRRREKVI